MTLMLALRPHVRMVAGQSCLQASCLLAGKSGRGLPQPRRFAINGPLEARPDLGLRQPSGALQTEDVAAEELPWGSSVQKDKVMKPSEDVTGASRHSQCVLNSNGVSSVSPGLARNAGLPWVIAKIIPNRNGVAAFEMRPGDDSTPSGLRMVDSHPQGSSCLATLG
jgi:hypothetical protein